MASTWDDNAGIVNGLDDVGFNSVPTTFYIGSDLYLISGEYDGVWNGWKWTETTGTNCQVNIGDVWKPIEAMQINIGDVWKAVASAKVNIGDDWKTIF